MNKKNKIIYFFLTSLLFYGSFFMYNNHIFASGPDHIVISEIQIGGEKANDEFIELYNPTNSKVDLTGWDLKKKTSGTEYNNILTNIEGSIPAYGYFLIIPRAKCGTGDESCYKGLVTADDEYTTTNYLADNNTLLLYNANGEVVDKVGWGDASDFEGTAVNMTDYKKGESIARNNNIIQDTNNNSTDFVIQTIPNPQNSSSTTISYDITTPTNKNVIATISPSESVTVTNNNGNFSYTFTENGSFTFEFKNAIGNIGTAVANVNNIDKIAPSVISLGSGSKDYTIDTNATAELVFSEPLSTVSKTSVEDALTKGADKKITYVWNGNILTITGNDSETTTFANDVIVNVSDLVNNSAKLLLVDSALSKNQTTPNESGYSTVDNETPEVIITNPNQVANITINDGTTNPSIDLSSFISKGTGTIPQITIESEKADVAIPDSTVVMSEDNSWNGIIVAPTSVTIKLPKTSGQTKTLSMAIEIGFTGAKLSFSKAVRIVLPNQAGKKVGYTRAGTIFTEITSVCSADNQTTGNTLINDGDCKINVGSDLVIWTKHFTEFATYTQVATPSSGGVIIFTTLPTNISVIINGGNFSTTNANVILTLSASNSIQMAISNNLDFSGIGWENYTVNKKWTLNSGLGKKTVYVKFRSSNGGVSSVASDVIFLDKIVDATAESNLSGRVLGATSEIIADGDIIQCKSCSNPFAIYIVKDAGNIKYIRHLSSSDIFNLYGHLELKNLKQVDSLNDYLVSKWVRVNTGANGTARPTDKVYRINNNQTKFWINMTAEKFLSDGGAESAIYNINQRELDFYITGPDIMSL